MKIKNGLAAAEKVIRAVCETDMPLLKETALATLDAGGKRLRPALVLIAGQTGEYDLEKLVPGAAAIELIHMASLVHDDILDGASTRRGAPTVNSKWGTTTAVATGDFLFASAFALLARSDCPEANKVVSEAALTLSLGELRQLETSGVCGQDIDEYFDKIYKKTASLFSVSCRIGSLLSGGMPKETELLSEYGKNLGMAFQIYDDVLDLEGSEETLGKPIGTDLLDGTVTLPILYALEETSQDSRICAVLEADGPVQKEIDLAIDVILNTTAIEKTKKKAREFAEKAIEAARHLDKSETRDDLRAIGEFVVSRYH